jgi:hypothetical protein
VSQLVNGVVFILDLLVPSFRAAVLFCLVSPLRNSSLFRRGRLEDNVNTSLKSPVVGLYKRVKMASAKFARCFPFGDGKMCCKHWNGRYIIFQMRSNYHSNNEKSSTKEDNSEKNVSNA